MKGWQKLILYVVLVITVLALYVAALALPAWLVWNYAVVPVAGLAEISYGQTAGILFLLLIVSSSIGLLAKK